MTVLLTGAVAVLAALVVWSTWHNRRDFVSAPGVFRCNLRLRSEYLPGIAPTWAKWPCHALWVHDVLVIRRGLLRPTLWYLPVHMADGGLTELNPRCVRGLGRRPVSVKVVLDDNHEVELASADSDRPLLVGPFVAVAVGGLPGDPTPGVSPTG
jgi:hypothetical protein